MAALSSSGVAMADDERSVTGNAGFVGDYAFRGISQNFRNSAGLKYAAYPCGKTALIQSSRKWNAAELNENSTDRGFNLKHTYALTNWYGISGATGCTTEEIAGTKPSSKGSSYIEANFGYTFVTDQTPTLHAGHRKIRHFNLRSYSDFRIGVSKPTGGFAFAVAYTCTNASANNLLWAMGMTRNCVQHLRFERKPLVISYAPELVQRIY